MLKVWMPPALGMTARDFNSTSTTKTLTLPTLAIGIGLFAPDLFYAGVAAAGFAVVGVGLGLFDVTETR